MVTYEEARQVAAHLIKTVDPLCVVLFGSVAKHGQGEDLDLLVVVEDQAKDGQDLEKWVQRSLKLYANRYAIDHPFVLSQSVLRRYFLGGSPFLRLIQREGRCLYMKEAIQQWFAQAKDEFSKAEVLFQSGHDRGACFHAQQSVEKALQGTLLQGGWELERTHSLRKLTAIGKQYGVAEILSEDDVDFIDSVYPGQYSQVSQGKGAVQKGSSSKAAGRLARGAYIEYVSTTTDRERRWRTFSTDPDRALQEFVWVKLDVPSLSSREPWPSLNTAFSQHFCLEKSGVLSPQRLTCPESFRRMLPSPTGQRRHLPCALKRYSA